MTFNRPMLASAVLTATLLTTLLGAGCTNRTNVVDPGQPFTSRMALISVPGENQIYAFDFRDNRVSATLNTGTTPGAITTSPSGRQFLVANESDGTVSAFYRRDNESFQSLGKVTQGVRPFGIAYNPNTNFSEAYVAYQNGQIDILDTTREQDKPYVVSNVNITAASEGQLEGFDLRQIAVSKDGAKVYITDGRNGRVHTLQRRGARNFAVATSSRFDQNNPTSVDLRGISVSDTGRVYICNFARSSVYVFDGNTGQLLGSPIGLQDNVTGSQSVNPLNIAINKAQTKAYITGNGSSTISVIDLKNNRLLQNIPLIRSTDTASKPVGIAVTNDNETVYVTNSSGRNVSIIKASADINVKDDLIQNIGTSSSSADLPPLGDIAIIGN